MAAIGGNPWSSARSLTWAELTPAARLSRMAFTAAFDRDGGGMPAFGRVNRAINRRTR